MGRAYGGRRQLSQAMFMFTGGSPITFAKVIEMKQNQLIRLLIVVCISAVFTGCNPTSSSTDKNTISVKTMNKYAICRSLSKSGSLNGFTDHTDELKEFEISGTKEQKIEFYEYLRDNSMRWEEEWREEFEIFFPSVTNELPEMMREEDFTIIEE